MSLLALLFRLGEEFFHDAIPLDDSAWIYSCFNLDQMLVAPVAQLVSSNLSGGWVVCDNLGAVTRPETFLTPCPMVDNDMSWVHKRRPTRSTRGGIRWRPVEKKDGAHRVKIVEEWKKIKKK